MLKDLLAHLAGIPTQAGSRAYRNFVPDHDTELVRRFKKAGVVILGKTNTPEFGLSSYTEPETCGPTHNPYDLTRTPGGSSGGSAAAVASRMVPLASAGDGGGSIRIPATFCGLVGLKPSRGRNPSGPVNGEGWQGAVVEHVLTRTVRDSAAMLDCTAGPEPGSRLILPTPEGSFLECVGKTERPLRNGFTTTSPLGGTVHPECIQAVVQTAKHLESLGHHVEEATPDIDGLAMAKAFFTMLYSQTAAEVAQSREALHRKPRPSDFELNTYTMAVLGRAYRSEEFIRALQLWDHAARQMGKFHQTYDLYLTPTAATPAVKSGGVQPSPVEKVIARIINTLNLGGLLKKTGLVEKVALDALNMTPFTTLANQTGQPAISLPVHQTPEGLPVGVMFTAALGREDLLFGVAGELEEEVKW